MGAERYANGVSLDDPRLSPIHGEMAGLPPVHLNVGTEDPFLADVRRLRGMLERAAVDVTYIEQLGAGHCYPQLGRQRRSRVGDPFAGSVDQCTPRTSRLTIPAADRSEILSRERICRRRRRGSGRS